MLTNGQAFVLLISTCILGFALHLFIIEVTFTKIKKYEDTLLKISTVFLSLTLIIMLITGALGIW